MDSRNVRVISTGHLSLLSFKFEMHIEFDPSKIMHLIHVHTFLYLTFSATSSSDNLLYIRTRYVFAAAELGIRHEVMDLQNVPTVHTLITTSIIHYHVEVPLKNGQDSSVLKHQKHTDSFV